MSGRFSAYARETLVKAITRRHRVSINGWTCHRVDHARRRATAAGLIILSFYASSGCNLTLHVPHHIGNIGAEGFGRFQIAGDHLIHRGIGRRSHEKAHVAAQVIRIVASGCFVVCRVHTRAGPKHLVLGGHRGEIADRRPLVTVERG